MHYTGTIWRPPYEAYSALVQVTAGCTHHKCKFCTLYEDVPFKFRMSPDRSSGGNSRLCNDGNGAYFIRYWRNL